MDTEDSPNKDCLQKGYKTCMYQTVKLLKFLKYIFDRGRMELFSTNDEDDDNFLSFMTYATYYYCRLDESSMYSVHSRTQIQLVSIGTENSCTKTN